MKNTGAYKALAWISFVVSTAGLLVGLYILEMDIAIKGFFAMSFLFSVSSCFTLAKVIGDEHEQEQFAKRME